MATKRPTRRASSKPKYMAYPPNHVSMRSGIKVGWRTWATEAEARRASMAAQHNARIQADLGYDFGYQWPGHISKVENGWEVTLP